MGKYFIAFLVAFSLCLESLVAQVANSRWVTTDVFSGAGIQNSAPIHFYGTKWRISYTQTGVKDLKIYKKPFDGDKITCLNINGQHLASFSSGNFKETDDCYLIFYGKGGNWTISLEQYLDVGGEWKYRQVKKNQNASELVAYWENESDDKFVYEAKDEKCHLDFSLAADGLCEVTILGPKGTVVFSQKMLTKGKGASAWIYQAGEYVVQVKTNVAWSAEAYLEK